MKKKIMKMMLFSLMFVFSISNIYAAKNPYKTSQTINGVTTIPCTHHAWNEVYFYTGIELPLWGNAKDWYSRAKKAGYATGDVPKTNSLFVSFDGAYGHVGWILYLSGDGMWFVSEGGVRTDDYKPYNGNGLRNRYMDFKDTTYKFIYVTEPVTHTHKFGAWKVTKKATCEKEGKETRSCICGQSETKVIKAIRHAYSEEWIIDEEATCEKNGSKSYHCKNCNEKKDVTVIKALGHSYSEEWIVDKQPTCLEKGSKSHTCSNCGQKKDVTEIEELGHEYADYIIDKEATCTKEGEKSKYCIRCNNREDILQIEATGHEYGQWIIKHKATDYEQGIKERVCVKCQSKDIELLPRTHRTIVILIVLGSVLVIFTMILIVADIKYKNKIKKKSD